MYKDISVLSAKVLEEEWFDYFKHIKTKKFGFGSEVLITPIKGSHFSLCDPAGCFSRPYKTR
jgi:hypothetical protein